MNARSLPSCASCPSRVVPPQIAWAPDHATSTTSGSVSPRGEGKNEDEHGGHPLRTRRGYWWRRKDGSDGFPPLDGTLPLPASSPLTAESAEGAETLLPQLLVLPALHGETVRARLISPAGTRSAPGGLLVVVPLHAPGGGAFLAPIRAPLPRRQHRSARPSGRRAAGRTGAPSRMTPGAGYARIRGSRSHR